MMFKVWPVTINVSLGNLLILRRQSHVVPEDPRPTDQRFITILQKDCIATCRHSKCYKGPCGLTLTPEMCLDQVGM